MLILQQAQAESCRVFIIAHIQENLVAIGALDGILGQVDNDLLQTHFVANQFGGQQDVFRTRQHHERDV